MTLLPLQNICLVIILFYSAPLKAEEALTPVNFKGIYSFGMMGLEFGAGWALKPRKMPAMSP